MSLADIIIVIVIVAIIVAAVVFEALRRNKSKDCGSGCGSCPHSGTCGEKHDDNGNI